MKTTYKILGKIKHWWMPFFAGVILVIAAILMIMFPPAAFIGLSIWFGWMLFALGGFNLVFAIRNRKTFTGWIWYLFLGLLEMGLGIMLLFHPALAGEALIIYLAFWLVYLGTMRMSFAFVLKDMGEKYWWAHLLGGFIMWLLAFLAIFNPVIGALTTVYFVAVPMLIGGILAMMFGWNLKKLGVKELVVEEEIITE